MLTKMTNPFRSFSGAGATPLMQTGYFYMSRQVDYENREASLCTLQNVAFLQPSHPANSMAFGVGDTNETISIMRKLRSQTKSRMFLSTFPIRRIARPPTPVTKPARRLRPVLAASRTFVYWKMLELDFVAVKSRMSFQ